jgi:hypothetical protein
VGGPQRGSDLGKERVLRVDVRGVDCQDLFELIEDQHDQLGLVAICRGRLMLDVVEIVTECQAGGIDRWEVGGATFFRQREERTSHVPIQSGALVSRLGWRLTDANNREDDEISALHSRNQPGLNE